MTIYLYKKTHKVTGLKYLGKTSSTNPHNYKGSGTFWKRHIEKHGYDVETEILKECQTNDEIKFWGTYYSNLWNIVTSSEWANLKEEAGDGGRHSDETISRISATMKGRPAHNKGLKQPHKKHKSRSDAGTSRNSTNGSNSKLKGRVRPKIQCTHCKRDIDEANYHRYHGPKCKLNSQGVII
jgi:hypothetical protein